MLGKQAGANKPGPQSLRLCLLHEGVAGANNPGRQSLRLCLLHEGVAGANKPGRHLRLPEAGGGGDQWCGMVPCHT
eukprot:1160582-Pelagomonas_calceolata.AAC.3